MEEINHEDEDAEEPIVVEEVPTFDSASILSLYVYFNKSN